MAFLLSNFSSPDSTESAILSKWGVGRYRIMSGSDWSAAAWGSTFTGGSSASEWVNGEADDAGFEVNAASDMDAFKADIDSSSPGVQHVMIDFETAPWQRLVGTQSGSTVAAAQWEIDRFAWILDYAASIDPGRKWGYYGVPERKWYNLDGGAFETAWYSRTDQLASNGIFSKSGFICPSLYVPVGSPTNPQLITFCGKNTYNALRVAGSVKVLPTATSKNQSDGWLFTGADWASMAPAIWAATDADWQGNSGSTTIDGIATWVSNPTYAELDWFLKWISYYSPKSQPMTIV